MTDSMDPVQALASQPPDLSAAAVRSVIREQYRLDGELHQLVSERDQNLRLTTADGSQFVVKIANSAEPRVVTECQVQGLVHLAKQGCPVPVPRVIPTQRGDPMTVITDAGQEFLLRVVNYLPGRPLEDVPLGATLARRLGVCLAQIGVALRNFEHPGDSHRLLWDIRRVDSLRPLVKHIAERRLRDTVQVCMNEFAANALPDLETLRSQVIHNDLNPGNVVVASDDPGSIAGVIDFGDMLRAPRIVDVAVGAAYLRDGGDALALIAPFVAGYNAVTRLGEREHALLYDLVRMRLATSIAILAWRKSARAADDVYTLKTEEEGGGARDFLDRISAVSKDEFTGRLRASG